jgi:hypothetical protein
MRSLLIVLVRYNLDDAPFENVKLLLNGPRRGDTHNYKPPSTTTPPLRVVINADGLRCKYAYPQAGATRNAFDTLYFPPVKQLETQRRDQPVSGPSLCKILGFTSESDDSAFFVFWGLNQITHTESPWRSRATLPYGSPWCRIVDWQEMLGIAHGSGVEESKLLDLFHARADMIMGEYNGISRGPTGETNDPDLSIQASDWAREEPRLIDSRYFPTGGGTDSGGLVCVRTQEVMFLNRVLFELSINR